MQETRKPYRNILIIKPGAVGDLLQMTPVIRALRRYYPDARITMLVGSALTASLFAHDPRISETIVFDRHGRHRSASALIGLWRMLRARRFDLVLNFQRSNLRTWFLAAAALPCRVLVYHKARNRTVHAVANYLETLAPLGIVPSDTGLELFLDESARAFARALFAEHGLDTAPVVALNPGATHAVNRWPAERFAELADLIAATSGARVIIVGGPDDMALAGDIVKRSGARPLSLAGTTTLLQLGAVLEQCRVVVSGDTGPLHLATAVVTKVIALFGAADPDRTGPVGSGHQVIRARGVACVPCRSRSCSNPNYLECMGSIPAQEVADAVAAMLQGK
ncbi:MAG: glycosyltransferase family 9 protein [Nitrospirota bacterium]